MTDPLFSDAAFRTSQTALDGLALRQEVVGRNLANVDTPGYTAQSVSFEDTLQRAESQTATVRLNITNAAHQLGDSDRTGLVRLQPRTGGSVRADGNNVDVDQELMEMAETGLRFQAISQLVSKKLLLLRSIATGR